MASNNRDVQLSYHRNDGDEMAPGYWTAHTDANGSIEYDASGPTGLDALMNLARKLFEALGEER